MFKLFNIKIILFLTYCITTFAEEPLSYSIHWQGLEKAEVVSTLEKSSYLISMQKMPSKTLTALRQRIKKDLPILIQSLQYHGYYDAKIEPQLTRKTQHIKINFNVDLGPIYKIESFNLNFNPKDFKLEIPSNVQVGQAALTQNILDAEVLILTQLQNNGYPLAKKLDRKALVDRIKKTLRLHFNITTGPFLYTTEPNIVGLEKVKTAYVLKQIQWKPGEVFSMLSLKKTQKNLEESGLFSLVQVLPATEAQGNILPVTIALSERKHHSIALGVGFNSYNGAGVLLEWEHRNVKKQGKALKFDGNIAENSKTVALTFLEPHFLFLSQSLLWTLGGEKMATKSYIKESFELSAVFNRSIAEILDFSLKAKMEQQRTTRSSKNGINTLLSFPILLNAYFVDSKTHPKRGLIFRYNISPYTILGSNVAFLKQSLTGGYYLPLNRHYSLVLNTWLTLGSITGQNRQTIPIPERFLAGSDHSLRGYAYKTVSPLDDERKPQGGRSILLTGAELTYSFSPQLSGALFFEAGNVFENMFPRFENSLLRSWGMGMRYHTPVGPVRLDLAFPMDKRKNIDQTFQIYLSIGQSF